MARVKIQIDLTKERPSHVWVGFKNSDPNKGRWQKIQYEGIPDYCMYCKHQGHVDNVCTIKRRDEDFKRRKEMEVDKKNKTKGEQEKGGTKVTQVQDNGKTETTTSAQAQQQLSQKGDYRPDETQRQAQEKKNTLQVNNKHQLPTYRVSKNRRKVTKKNTGRLKKRSKTEIRNNSTPRLHGDLFQFNTKELRTTNNRSQHQQVYFLQFILIITILT